MLEAGEALATESRASTFHPPTLDMLDDLGVASDLIRDGLEAPAVQYRSGRDGLIAQFDFGDIADLTRHPFRLQIEQSRLTRVLLQALQPWDDFEIAFGARVVGVEQDEDGVRARVEDGASERTWSGAYLIGTDGARSSTRRAAGIEFEGFTWPERFLVLSTPFDFKAVLPDLVSVNYVADPEHWHFLLQIPDLWRVMFPVRAEVSDETALGPEFGQSLMARVVPGLGGYDIVHTTLYRVHQRVARQFRVGRVLLAGDAAHVNNPLGGMGMNGGIHDAVNLGERLADVWHGRTDAATLDEYDRQRRGITLETVQTQTIQNKRDLEAADPDAQDEFRDRLRGHRGRPGAPARIPHPHLHDRRPAPGRDPVSAATRRPPPLTVNLRRTG